MKQTTKDKRNFFTLIKNIWKENDKSDRLFLISFISLLFAILFLFAFELNLFSIPIFIGAIAVIKELNSLFDKLWNHNISKAFLLLGYAFIINISLLISSKMINLITGVESKHFFYSSNILAMLNSIPLAYIISILILLIVNPYITYPFIIKDIVNKFKTLFSKEKEKVDKSHFIKTYRILFYTVLPIYLIFSATFINVYFNYANQIANWSIYYLEANEKSFCQLNKDEKSIMIGNDVLIIKKVSDNNITYTMKKCIKKY